MSQPETPATDGDVPVSERVLLRLATGEFRTPCDEVVESLARELIARRKQPTADEVWDEVLRIINAVASAMSEEERRAETCIKKQAAILRRLGVLELREIVQQRRRDAAGRDGT